MRINQVPLLSAADATINENSLPLNLEFMFGYAIQCVFSSGSCTGTLSLQGSNDVDSDANFNAATFQPTNWTTISGTSTSVTAGGSVMFNAQGTYYRWVR